MNDKVWTYISALGSVGFGWLLNELGQFLKLKREDKRIKKKVLFYLLETLHTFKQLDTTRDIELLSQKILARLPKESQTLNEKNKILGFYKLILPKLAESGASKNLLELEESYKKCIDDLSLVDPISAYRLKGKNQIIEAFNLLYDYFDLAKQQFPNEAMDIDNQSQNAIQELKPELLNSSIKEIEEEIKSISMSIGFLVNWKAKKIINKASNGFDQARMEKIDAMLEKLLPSAQ